jgi:phosphatidylglycerophosphate synthase
MDGLCTGRQAASGTRASRHAPWVTGIVICASSWVVLELAVTMMGWFPPFGGGTYLDIVYGWSAPIPLAVRWLALIVSVVVLCLSLCVDSKHWKQDREKRRKVFLRVGRSQVISRCVLAYDALAVFLILAILTYPPRVPWALGILLLAILFTCYTLIGYYVGRWSWNFIVGDQPSEPEVTRPIEKTE